MIWNNLSAFIPTPFFVKKSIPYFKKNTTVLVKYSTKFAQGDQKDNVIFAVR